MRGGGGGSGGGSSAGGFATAEEAMQINARVGGSSPASASASATGYVGLGASSHASLLPVPFPAPGPTHLPPSTRQEREREERMSLRQPLASNYQYSLGGGQGSSQMQLYTSPAQSSVEGGQLVLQGHAGNELSRQDAGLIVLQVSL